MKSNAALQRDCLDLAADLRAAMFILGSLCENMRISPATTTITANMESGAKVRMTLLEFNNRVQATLERTKP